jgi:hypothetical protein
MKRATECVAVLAISLLLGGLSAADDKKGDKDKAAPSGAWVLQEGQLKIDFTGKGAMKIYPHGDDTVVIVCEYTAAKGLVKVKITDFEGTKDEVKAKVKEKVPAGTELEFQWKVKDGTATLSDVKGGGDNGELLKSRLEGKYDQKKKEDK